MSGAVVGERNQSARSSRRLGVVQVLLSGFCFGFLGVLGRRAFEKGVAVGEILSLRFLFASFFLISYLLIRFPRVLRVSFKQLIACALLGIIGYAVFSSFYFYALETVSASLTVLLLYLFPVLVAIGGWVLFSEKIPRSRLIAIPIAMVGLFLLVSGNLVVEKVAGVFFGVASAVTYAIYILASSRLLRTMDSLAATAYQQLFAGLALTGMHLHSWLRVTEILREAWLPILALALVCSVLAMALFLSGLKKLMSWEASVLSLAEPITAVTMAMVFLGDRLTPWQILGAVAVLAALIFVSVPQRARVDLSSRPTSAKF